MGDKNHTILLLQTAKHDSTRFYQDFSTVSNALEGFLKMYETRLREMNPSVKSITYELSSLFQYIDDIRELVVLSFDDSIKGYRSYDRKWLKSKLQDLLVGSVKR
mmetsp:Transcript_35445/g.78642  ORF Transcript_35445/g.78642 Transcript_35445/m.78642 type:complete len:105 (-) Transcript_35445:2658-2972(-)